MTQQFRSEHLNNSCSRILPFPQSHTQTSVVQYDKPHPLSLSNSFVKDLDKQMVGVEQIWIVDLRTSVSQIKQELIESKLEKHVVFRIP